MRTQTSPHEVRSLASRKTEALRASATQSHHSVDGPNSLEVATRGLLSADTDVGWGFERETFLCSFSLHYFLLSWT